MGVDDPWNLKRERNMGVRIGWLLLLLGAAPEVRAEQLVLNFDSIPGMPNSPGTSIPTASRLSDAQLATHGIRFSSGAPYVAVVNIGLNHATSGTNALGGATSSGLLTYNGATPLVFTFLNPADPAEPYVTDFISIRGDTNPGGQSISLRAYNASGTLIDTVTKSDTGGTVLSISRAGIHRVEYIGTQDQGGVAIDDVTFNRPARIDGDGDGYSTYIGDCDDTDPDRNPGEVETCDGIDQDCDGTADEDSSDASSYYPDGDGDGYGGLEGEVAACEAPDGFVEVSGDCDDEELEVHPDAIEQCDGADNDCDGETDEGLTFTDYYPDGDGDGYGQAGSTGSSCASLPPGTVAVSGDCNDGNAAVHPGVVDGCDGVDSDCDGGIDEDGVSTFYPDADGDTWGQVDGGEPGDTVVACGAPAGYVASTGDCDDHAVNVSPGAPEVCDEVDNDCDGQVDELAADPTAFYPDGDGDGYGAQVDPVLACAAPAGFVVNDDDCDDEDPDTHPGAAEDGLDGIDHDCDGVVTPVDTATPEPSPVDSPTPGDETPGGDDDATGDDDDDATGDDDDTSSTPGDDDDGTGDDDDVSPTPGDDDDGTGDDDTTGDDDDDSPTPGGDDGEGCACSHRTRAPSASTLFGALLTLALVRRRRP